MVEEFYVEDLTQELSWVCICQFPSVASCIVFHLVMTGEAGEVPQMLHVNVVVDLCNCSHCDRNQRQHSCVACKMQDSNVTLQVYVNQ
jgi:hypothetical protein